MAVDFQPDFQQAYIGPAEHSAGSNDADGGFGAESGRQDAALYGSQDGCRYVAATSPLRRVRGTGLNPPMIRR